MQIFHEFLAYTAKLGKLAQNIQVSGRQRDTYRWDLKLYPVGLFWVKINFTTILLFLT